MTHDRPFTVICNSVPRSTTLSWKAKGLMSYLVGLPQDWIVNLSHLSNLGPDGRDCTRSALAELEKAGYVMLITERDSGGKIVNRYYYVRESLDIPFPQSPSPKLGNPKYATPTCEDGTLLKKYRTNDRPDERKNNTNLYTKDIGEVGKPDLSEDVPY